MAIATDIREQMYPSVRSNTVTAFDSVVSGTTGAKKVWRGDQAPKTDSGAVRIKVPYTLIWGFEQRRGRFSNKDQDSPDGRFMITTTAAKPSTAGAIAAAIQARLTKANVTATGFALKLLRLDEDFERTESDGGKPAAYHVDQIFIYSAYPS